MESMAHRKTNLGRISTRYAMLALFGSFLLMTLPLMGVLALWCPVWVVVIALIVSFGLAIRFAIPMGEPWIAWAFICAAGLSVGLSTNSYDQRIVKEARELGPIPVSDISSYPNQDAFFLTDFEVGKVEGWHEVCGEESCSEYELLSVTPPGLSLSTPIDLWIEVGINRGFDPHYAFEIDTSSSSQEKGIAAACAISRFSCTTEPRILEPLHQKERDILSSDTFLIMGVFTIFAWLFPCFIAWIRALWKGRKRA
jgi:hypothetical protein